jgi:hypothetical protein
MWIISNLEKPASCSLTTRVKTDNYSICSSLDFFDLTNTKSAYKVFGEVFSSSLQDRSPNLNSKYLDQYFAIERSVSDVQSQRNIEHLDGNFIIIHYDDQGFRIYGDKFGIKKYFFYSKDGLFVISSHISLIKEFFPLEISIENNIIYALTYHYTGGLTSFKNVRHNQPGEFLEYKQGKLLTHVFWSPTKLLGKTNTKINIKDLSAVLENSIKKRIGLNQKISLSLTGGGDTRNLLALFLSQELSTHLYTYGNPNSADCSCARDIARGLNLDHDIHDVFLNAQIFEKYARRIIRDAEGMASIHRVHRVIAIEKEREYASNMFLGTLGGEFIKGAEHDNYIIPAIVYENWTKERYDADWVIKYLKSKRINLDTDIDNVLTYIKSEPFFNGSEIHRKLFALTNITAHLHDAQDIMLYENIMNSVFTPFLDANYLELLFSSEYSFIEKEKKSSNYFLKKIEYPVFAAKFLQATYPPLLSYRYSGYHKPSEVLFNKYYAAIAKLFRKNIYKAYPANFPLSQWMEEFVKTNLTICLDYNAIRRTYDLETILKDFENGNHLQHESYWLKYTNPIMMRFIIEEFKDD